MGSGFGDACMADEGIDAYRIIGADVEPMGEFVRLRFATDDGDFIVRLPAEELRVALPDLLTVPGRAQAEADPIGSPTPPPGSAAKARALGASAAVIRTNTGSDRVFFEFHIGDPPYPVFFSFPRDGARQIIEAAARALSKPGTDS
jgi:hypothetical protein